MHDEFAAAVVARGKAAAINLGACLMNRSYPERSAGQYLECLAGLKAKGVRFSLGSDGHAAGHAPEFEGVARMLERIGVRDEDRWRLPARESGSCPPQR